MNTVALSLAVAALMSAVVGVTIRLSQQKRALKAPASGARCAGWRLRVIGRWSDGEEVYLDRSDGVATARSVSFQAEQTEGLYDDLKPSQTLQFGDFTFENPPLSKADRFECVEEISPIRQGSSAFMASGALALLAMGTALP